jgi:hypothetical protein
MALANEDGITAADAVDANIGFTDADAERRENRINGEIERGGERQNKAAHGLCNDGRRGKTDAEHVDR